MGQPYDAIIGGAGFIGSHLCQALLGSGQRVKVIDDFSTGKEENLTEAGADSALCEVVHLDIRQEEALARALDGVTTVFHLAAMTSVEESVRDPQKAHSINLTGTLSVLSAARRAGARKLIFASSTAVYGNPASFPVREDRPFAPRSPYAASKAAGELYCQVYSATYDLPTVCLRYFNVFGPRQDPDSPYAAVIPRFIDRIICGRPPIIFGDGEQTRDFVFVGDVVEANLKAAQSDLSGQSLNVATGARLSLNQLVEKLNQLAGTELNPEYQAARLGEVRHSQAAVERARKLIGFQAGVPLQEGLAQTLKWFKAKKNT